MSASSRIKVKRSPTPATRSDLVWSRAARDLEIDALPTIRAAAERWTTMMLGVTGFLSAALLVGAPDQIPALENRSTQILTGICFAVAIVAAGVSVALAALASQGRVVAAVLSGPDFRRVTENQSREARLALGISRTVSIICLPALLTGLALLTYGARDSGLFTEVQLQSGAIVCGKFEGSHLEEFSIRLDGNVLRLERGEIIDIRVVSACK